MISAESDARSGHLNMSLPNPISAPELGRSLRIFRGLQLQAELHGANPYARLYEHVCNVQHRSPHLLPDL